MARRNRNKQAPKTEFSPVPSGENDWYAARMLATIVQVVLGLFLIPAAIALAANEWGWAGAVIVGLLIIPFWRVSGDFLNPDEERKRSFRAFCIYYLMTLAYIVFMPLVLILAMLEVVKYAFAVAAGFASLIASASLAYWIAQTYFGFAGGVQLTAADARLIWYGFFIAIAMDVFVGLLFRFAPPAEQGWLTRLMLWYRDRLEALENSANKNSSGPQ